MRVQAEKMLFYSRAKIPPKLVLLFYSSFFPRLTTGSLRCICSPLVTFSLLVIVSLPLAVSTCLVGCCVFVLCLVVCAVPLRRSVALLHHFELCCVVTSCHHNTLSCRLVVLSCLASLLRCAPLRILSHLLCSVDGCAVALHLVVASSHGSHCCNLLLYLLLLPLHCVLLSCPIALFFVARSGLVGCCVSCPQPLVARCHINVDAPVAV